MDDPFVSIHNYLIGIWSNYTGFHWWYGDTDDEADFYAAKVATAKFFMDKILPQTGALFSSIMAGSGSIIDFPEASF